MWMCAKEDSVGRFNISIARVSRLFDTAFFSTLSDTQLKKGKATEKGAVTSLWLSPHSGSRFTFMLCACIGVCAYLVCSASDGTLSLVMGNTKSTKTHT